MECGNCMNVAPKVKNNALDNLTTVFFCLFVFFNQVMSCKATGY